MANICTIPDVALPVSQLFVNIFLDHLILKPSSISGNTLGNIEPKILSSTIKVVLAIHAVEVISGHCMKRDDEEINLLNLLHQSDLELPILVPPCLWQGSCSHL
jgi:hypothetical protein